MKRLQNSWIFFLALSFALGACQEKGPETLPILGFKTVDTQGDTVYHKIPPFGFVDQDSNFITEAVTEGKVSVVDFFFTSCPDICPKMKQQMIRLHDEFMDNEQVVLLSHTIDPAHDTVGVLHDYAEALGIESHKWHMFTGTKDSLYAMAAHYMISAAESETAAGGFIHSGKFVLIDQQGRVRGYYEGTDPAEVDQLIQDIPKLLDAQSP